MQVLVVEDEAKVMAFITKGLDEQGYQVSSAIDGEQGLQLALAKPYHLIVLDVMLPKLSGLDVCKALRAQGIQTPVLMLTALGTTDDIVTGLDSGADDYLVKPFNFGEFLARIRALTRRHTPHNGGDAVLRIANLEMNIDAKTVKRDETMIRLTAKEFALLEFFIKNKGKVLNRMDIAEKVWDINFDTGTNVIDVYVNYLRAKIDKGFSPKLIHTLVGMGYVMKEE